MGNASSSSTSSRQSTSRTVAATTRHRPVLSESEAWAIALTWRDQLRGCVRLHEERERVNASLVWSFEWVAFIFNGDLRNGFRNVEDAPMMTAYARAATIAWFALSCCEGYSGTEKPEFWKRVFLEFLYPRNVPKHGKREPYPDRAQAMVTEAVRFFATADKPFPRVKLVLEYKEQILQECTRIFLGRQAHSDENRDQQLLQIMSKLKPFIRSQHWTRHIPVAIADVWSSRMVELLLLDVAARGEIDPEPESLTDLPQIKLHSVVAHVQSAFSEVDGLSEKLAACDVTLRTSLKLCNIVQGRRLANHLLCEMNKPVDQLPLPRLDVYQLYMWQSTELSYSHLGVLCSALPFLKSIKTMNLQHPRLRYTFGLPSSPASDWAWLGYATFHPDATESSGFMSLDIDIDVISSEDIEELQRMATGNNLLGDTKECSSWIEGYVSSTTEVLTDPRQDADALHTVVEAAWISLCVPSVDVLSFQEWVCGVIPGYGLGWMRSCDVVETRSRPPGRSCLRYLRLNSISEQVDVQKLTKLLTVWGDALASLEIHNNKPLAVSTVHTVVRLCPALKSLRIHHDGSFWAGEQPVVVSPSLEELQLNTDWQYPPVVAITTINPLAMPRLKALRVYGWFSYNRRQHESLFESLLRQHRWLQYLHWSSADFWTNWIDHSYDRMHKATRKFRRRFRDRSLLIDFCDVKLTLDCRLAFLSVGYHCTRGEEGVRRLDQDVVSLIFTYATSTKKREIFISA